MSRNHSLIKKVVAKIWHYLSFGRRRAAASELYILTSSFGYYDDTASMRWPCTVSCPRKMFMYENTNINEGAKFIISPYGNEGKFIMKKNSGSAANLVVITGNHQRKVGTLFKTSSVTHDGDIDKDVIIEEDVWIAANVTILAGVVVGRGATIGAGAVCIKSVPPYAIAMGNPAKVVGFNFTPEEAIEHEKALYPEEDRLPQELLEKNYNKYFLERITEIKKFNRI